MSAAHGKARPMSRAGKGTGFTWFFVGTSLIGLPVALLAVFVWAKVGLSDEAKPGTIAAH